MTTYANSLVEYCMWYGKRTRDEAIAFLKNNATPLWQLSIEQPTVNDERIALDCGEE